MSGNRKSPPISSHPAFPAAVAAWFAALFGMGLFVLPSSALEGIVGAFGIPSMISAAAPPLGMTARLILSLVGALIGVGVGFAIAKVIAKKSLSEPIEAEAPVFAEVAEPTETTVELENDELQQTETAAKSAETQPAISEPETTTEPEAEEVIEPAAPLSVADRLAARIKASESTEPQISDDVAAMDASFRRAEETADQEDAAVELDETARSADQLLAGMPRIDRDEEWTRAEPQVEVEPEAEAAPEAEVETWMRAEPQPEDELEAEDQQEINQAPDEAMEERATDLEQFRNTEPSFPEAEAGAEPEPIEAFAGVEEEFSEPISGFDSSEASAAIESGDYEMLNSDILNAADPLFDENSAAVEDVVEDTAPRDNGLISEESPPVDSQKDDTNDEVESAVEAEADAPEGPTDNEVVENEVVADQPTEDVESAHETPETTEPLTPNLDDMIGRLERAMAKFEPEDEAATEAAESLDEPSELVPSDDVTPQAGGADSDDTEEVADPVVSFLRHQASANNTAPAMPDAENDQEDPQESLQKALDRLTQVSGRG